jgi:hypothetical protein
MLKRKWRTFISSRDTHRTHEALRNNRSRSVVVDHVHETGPEGIDVLSLNGYDLQAVTPKGLSEIVSLEVFRRMSGNSDVVIVDEELNVEILGDSEPSSFCVVALLLRSIGTQAEDSFVTVGQSNPVNHRPHVSETSGGEFDSGSQTQLGMTGKLGVGSTVVEEVFRRDSSLEGGEQVLGSNTVTWIDMSISINLG